MVTELRQTRTDGRSVSFGSTCRVAHVVHAAGRAVETTACPSPARGPLAARRGSRAVCPDAQGTRVRRATRMDFCGACAATPLRWAEDCAAVWAAVTWRFLVPACHCLALGVAAGPGHAQPQALGGRRSAGGGGGDGSAHGHAAVATCGGSVAQPLLPRSLRVARAAAVRPAAADGRCLRCASTRRRTGHRTQKR